jgi:hypothetical protein
VASRWLSEPAIIRDRHEQGLPCEICTARIPDITGAPDEQRHAIVHDVVLCRERCLPIVERILARALLARSKGGR